MKRVEKIHQFVEEIWEWYGHNKRDLPWRDLTINNDTERAYRIMVSEVMLQQTQVSRVTVIYKRFLEEFPKLNNLACASNRHIITAWRGMGYNSRALRLRNAAKIILDTFDEKFPQEMQELQSIPGIGYYTAAAIRNFAFNLPTPCIEINIRRVLHTVFVGRQNSDGTWKRDDQYLLMLASDILPIALQKGSTADWHHALMDYGSLALPKVKVRMVHKKEPGRMVGSTYIPNRIFRGKIVEELRNASDGLTSAQLGRRVCIDWEPSEHAIWLDQILQKLTQDALITKRKTRFVLR